MKAAVLALFIGWNAGCGASQRVCSSLQKLAEYQSELLMRLEDHCLVDVSKPECQAALRSAEEINAAMEVCFSD